MSVGEKYYVQAEIELQRIKALNEQTAEQRQTDFAEKFPEYRTLKATLAKTGSELADILFTGKDFTAELVEIEARNLAVQNDIENLLRSAGFSANYLDVKYSCELCGDTGVYGNRRCKCFNNLVTKSVISDLNKTSNLALSSFERFDFKYYNDNDAVDGINIKKLMMKHFNDCKKYAEDFCLPNNGMFLHGKTGLGKTHLSLAIANEVIKKGYGVIYKSAPDLFGELYAETFDFNNKEKYLMSYVLSADLLIIDDLGTEVINKYSVSHLYNIINTRMNKRLPVIINTNLDSQELEDKYEQRTVSRINNMRELYFLGKDLRQIIAKETG